MSGAVLTLRAPAITAAPPLVHRYLVTGSRSLRPGDKALCGFVKPRPGGEVPYGLASCVVCLALTPKGLA